MKKSSSQRTNTCTNSLGIVSFPWHALNSSSYKLQKNVKQSKKSEIGVTYLEGGCHDNIWSGFQGSLQVPNVNDAMVGTFADDVPPGCDSHRVDEGFLAFDIVILRHYKVNHARPEVSKFTKFKYILLSDRHFNTIKINKFDYSRVEISIFKCPHFIFHYRDNLS